MTKNKYTDGFGYCALLLAYLLPFAWVYRYETFCWRTSSSSHLMLYTTFAVCLAGCKSVISSVADLHACICQNNSKSFISSVRLRRQPTWICIIYGCCYIYSTSCMRAVRWLLILLRPTCTQRQTGRQTEKKVDCCGNCCIHFIQLIAAKNALGTALIMDKHQSVLHSVFWHFFINNLHLTAYS